MAIRLLHTADWHLGKMLYGRSMLPDQEYFLEESFFPAVRREKPDCVVLAGDIYDRQVPPAQAVQLFSKVVQRLHDEGVPLAAISGNHDGAQRMALAPRLLWEQGAAIATCLKEAFSPLRLQKDGQTVAVYLLPYFEPAQARDFLGREDIRGYGQAYAAVLEELIKGFQPGEKRVLVSHCFVTGCQVSDSEGPLYVGGSGEVSAGLFEQFDYVALGHLHAPQPAGSQARYAGSPLKYSFDEARQSKGMTLVTIDKQVETAQLPIQPLHDMRVISGALRQLLEDGAHDERNQDYLFARLTDCAPVYMPMERLRACYPNILGLSSEWLTAGGGDISGEAKQEPGKQTDDQGIFRAFLEQICDLEATKEDCAVFEQARAQLMQEETR